MVVVVIVFRISFHSLYIYIYKLHGYDNQNSLYFQAEDSIKDIKKNVTNIINDQINSK